MTIDAKIEPLFEKITQINREFAARRESQPDQFNIFRLLGMERDEEKTHTRFISELLDPHGSHKMGNAFLKQFLQILNKPDFPHEHAHVEIERFIGNTTKDTGGIIDLIIESAGNMIIIENKIDALDQPNQLLRYHNFSKHAEMLYLTIDGKNPHPCSLGGQEFQFRCISYKEHILPWLERCIDTAENPYIKECIRQYMVVVTNITGTGMQKEEAMQMTNEIMEKDEYILAILGLIGDHGKLFSALQERMKKVLTDVAVSHAFEIHFYKNLNSKNSGWKLTFKHRPEIPVYFEFQRDNFVDMFLGFKQELKKELDDRQLGKLKERFHMEFQEVKDDHTFSVYVNWHAYRWGKQISWYKKMLDGSLKKDFSDFVGRLERVLGAV